MKRSISLLNKAVEQPLPLLVSQAKNILNISLNRPKALNALNLPMCMQMQQILQDINNKKENKNIGAFVLTGKKIYNNIKHGKLSIFKTCKRSRGQSFLCRRRCQVYLAGAY